MLNCRVVFDTNILISAVLSPNSKPFQCTALAKREIVLKEAKKPVVGWRSLCEAQTSRSLGI
ncbi:MAG: hypothetical protein RLZZ338_497 [Cyanobacteriota bacterium]|jgi:hypothetical protein